MVSLPVARVVFSTKSVAVPLAAAGAVSEKEEIVAGVVAVCKLAAFPSPLFQATC